MDVALIRGLEALKKGIELIETGAPRRTIKSRSTKWINCKDSPRLAQLEAKGQTHAPC